MKLAPLEDVHFLSFFFYLAENKLMADKLKIIFFYIWAISFHKIV